MLGKGLESLIPKKGDSSEQLPERTGRPLAPAASGDLNSRPDDSALAKSDGGNQARRDSETFSTAIVQSKKKEELGRESIFMIEVDNISPNPHQPRQNFNTESLKELATSIGEFGILQPIIVSKIEKETETGTRVKYQLIAGERRVLAAKIAGLERIPAIIKNLSQKSEHLEIAIIENLQRAELSSIETARAYAKLQDVFGFTQREIAARLGKSRETIANALRLLSLPSEIQNALAQNKINESQARLLLSISNQLKQKEIFNSLLADNLSVRELRNKIKKEEIENKKTERNNTLNIDIETQHLEEQLCEILNAPVEIKKTEKGGKVVITFYSQEEIRGIIDKLK